MFYLLLIIPHLLAIVGLLAFGYYSSPDGREEPHRGPDDGSEPAPRAPRPSDGGPPLLHATAPRRRLRVGERLSELYPRRLRRAPDPAEPERTPARRAA